MKCCSGMMSQGCNGWECLECLLLVKLFKMGLGIGTEDGVVVR